MKAQVKLASMIAAAAAVAFVTAPVTSTLAQAASHKVSCYGVNACKGKSACKTAKNSCKGQNACKGQGFVKTSQAKCQKLGGTTTEQPAADQPAS